MPLHPMLEARLIDLAGRVNHANPCPHFSHWRWVSCVAAEIVLSIVIFALICDKIATRVGKRSYEEDVRFAFREGRKEGVAHYKEIWGIVETDFRRRRKRKLANQEAKGEAE